tara:strand:+ start:819 stop:1016 length:198 start_codon:yes stop_codon:yes gene_type:complete
MKFSIAIQIVQAIYPIAKNIAADIKEAKEADSDGGREITKAERQEIIFTNLIQVIPAIEDIVKKL